MAITVPVDIELKIDKAIKDSSAFVDQVSNQLGQVSKAAEQTSTAVNAIAFVEITDAAIRFGNTIVGVLKDAVKEATEADDAIKGLTSSLRGSGDFSARNVKAFEDLAEGLSNVSRFSDDTILAQARLGKQFGLTNRETAKLLKVAVDYAAFAKTDLSDAVRTLGQTFDGTAGRLVENVPALRNLSKEALRSGAALDVVAKIAGGSARRDIDSFSGSLEQAGNRFGNIFEELGKAFVQNDAVITIIREIGKAFQQIADGVKESKGELVEFVTTGVKVAIDVFVVFLEVLRTIDTFLRGLARALQVIATPLEAVVQSAKGLLTFNLNDLTQGLDLVGRFKKDFKAISDSGEKTNAAFDKLEDGAAAVSGIISRIQNTQSKIAVETSKVADGFDDQISKNERLLETDQERIERLQKQQDIIKKINEERAKELESLSKNPFAGAGTDRPVLGRGVSNFFEQSIFERTQNTVARGVAVATSALQGRQGAVNLVSQGAELAGQALLGIPGFGQLATLLSQGPDQVRELVKQFAEAIPEIITAVAESIPVVFETLADKLPDIITKLAERAPQIAVALAKAMPLVAISLGKSLLNAGKQFVDSIIKGAGEFISKILEGAGRFIEELVAKVGDAIGNVGKNVLGVGGGGGGILGGIGSVVGGVVGGVGGLLGFKTGSGGEFQSTQPMVVRVQIGQRDLATAMLDLNRQGFRTS